MTTLIGLGHSLWAFGILQVFSNLGYSCVAADGPNPPAMFGATGFESSRRASAPAPSRCCCCA